MSCCFLRHCVAPRLYEGPQNSWISFIWSSVFGNANNNHRDYEIEEPFWGPSFMLSWLHSISHCSWSALIPGILIWWSIGHRRGIRSYRYGLNIVLQRAKKVVSDSPGLVDIAIGLVTSVPSLPDGQVKCFLEFKLQKNCESSLLIKTVLWLVEMMFGLVNASFSLPERQAVKMTFLHPVLYWVSFAWLEVLSPPEIKTSNDRDLLQPGQRV